LQRVEFNWIALPGAAPAEGLGGELTFAWTPAGAVYVDRWRLRMPQDVTEIRENTYSRTRIKRIGIVEEGGVVFIDSSATGAGTATLYGDLRVEGRQPIAGAQVRVLGTSLLAMTDQAGKFQLSDVPAGLRVVVADHPQFSTFGMRAAALRVLLDAGENRNISLRAPGSEVVAKSLCGENALTGGRSLLRLNVVDSASTQPLGGFRLRLIGRGLPDSTTQELETDESGAALFCDLSPNQSYVLVSASGAVLLSEFVLGRNRLESRQLWVGR
jgi:hypothetical protein